MADNQFSRIIYLAGKCSEVGGGAFWVETPSSPSSLQVLCLPSSHTHYTCTPAWLTTRCTLAGPGCSPGNLAWIGSMASGKMEMNLKLNDFHIVIYSEWFQVKILVHLGGSRLTRNSKFRWRIRFQSEQTQISIKVILTHLLWPICHHCFTQSNMSISQ